MGGRARDRDTFTELAIRGELNTGLQRVVNRVAGRLARRLVGRQGGRRGGRIQTPAQLQRWLAYPTMAVFAFVPSLLLPLDLAVGCAHRSSLWALYYSFFDFCQMAFPWLVWRRLESGAADLDALFTRTDARRAAVSRMRQWLSTRRLLCFMIPGGVIGVVAAAGIHLVSGGSSICTSGYLSLFLTGAMVGHSLLLIIMITVLPLSFASRRVELKLLWHAPVDTPGLVVLSRSVSLTAQLGFVLFLIVQVRLGYEVVTSPSAFSLAFYVLASLTTAGFVTVVGVAVQHLISVRVSDRREQTMRELSVHIDEANKALATLGDTDQRGRHALGRLQTYVHLYTTVAATPGTFLRTAALGQYVGSLLGIALQLAFPLLVSNQS